MTIVSDPPSANAGAQWQRGCSPTGRGRVLKTPTVRVRSPPPPPRRCVELCRSPGDDGPQQDEDRIGLQRHLSYPDGDEDHGHRARGPRCPGRVRKFRNEVVRPTSAVGADACGRNLHVLFCSLYCPLPWLSKATRLRNIWTLLARWCRVFTTKRSITPPPSPVTTSSVGAKKWEKSRPDCWPGRGPSLMIQPVDLPQFAGSHPEDRTVQGRGGSSTPMAAPIPYSRWRDCLVSRA